MHVFLVYYSMYSHYRGKDFRVYYSHLAALCATFSNVPVIAMTATATKCDREATKM